MSNEQPTEDKKQSFWTTFPGIITAVSGLIVAITGMITVIQSTKGQNSAEVIPPTPIPTEIISTPVPTETRTPEPTAQSTATVEEIQPTTLPTPTETLVHSKIPSKPGNPVWFVDTSSLVYANDGQATGDDFLSLSLERPFTAQDMDYVGYVDIKQVEISEKKDFIYVSIIVEEAPSQTAQVYYGVELDTDMDGRGDWLIYGLVPPSTDWIVKDVKIFKDSDNNVGGPSPLTSNDGISGNGYETLLFDSGYGVDDPDLAWIRRSPDNGNYIEIAFKPSLIDFTERFLVSAWADAGPMQPAWFDYNDHFTFEEAGSPIRGASEYPLQGLALVDNTCRWAFGFDPAGNEPGLCP